ncbi:MAG: permease [Spirochaetales bacterium]|nr:permease [Spirochaetales bacterium]
MEIVINKLYLIFLDAGKMLVSLGPYLIGGVIIGELIKLTDWEKAIRLIFTSSPVLSIIVATIIGILSPLCTYGTVPIVVQLLSSGVPPAPLVTFLSVSSLMNPQLFIITWGGLGAEIALVRLLSVLVFGILFGLIVRLVPAGFILNPTVSGGRSFPGRGAAGQKKPFRVRDFLTSVWKNLQFVGFYVLIGIMAGSVIKYTVPASLIFSLFKPGEFYGIFVASILSVPLYACGGGTIPLIRALIDQGMSKASALAFLFVGPATRITPLMALASTIRPIFLFIYVTVIILYALLFGLVYPA